MQVSRFMYASKHQRGKSIVKAALRAACEGLYCRSLCFLRWPPQSKIQDGWSNQRRDREINLAFMFSYRSGLDGDEISRMRIKGFNFTFADFVPDAV